MRHIVEGGDNDTNDLKQDLIELREAVGLETHESTTDNRETSGANGNAARP